VKTPANSRIVCWPERSWATREFQRFTGRFDLDETSGLYFDCDIYSPHKRLIVQAFRYTPDLLRQAANTLALTVSTTRAPRTLLGDQSAVYGDWDRPPHQISPHLEMSEASIVPELLLPHLVHECSHLFWALQSKSARDRYHQEILKLVDGHAEEVTLYAQRFFNSWQKSIEAGGAAETSRRAAQKWLVESFCETVSKICCPWYKEEELLDPVHLIRARHVIMESIFGLVVSTQRMKALNFNA
jgi:hypothetical protein